MSDITPKDPYAAVPAYDPEDFGNWKLFFHIFINNGNLRDIIDGKLTATSGSSSSQRRVSMGGGSSEKEGDSVLSQHQFLLRKKIFMPKMLNFFGLLPCPFRNVCQLQLILQGIAIPISILN